MKNGTKTNTINHLYNYIRHLNGITTLEFQGGLCASKTTRAMPVGVFFFPTPGRATHAEQVKG